VDYLEAAIMVDQFFLKLKDVGWKNVEAK